MDQNKCHDKLPGKVDREESENREKGGGKWGKWGRTVNWTFPALQLGKLKIYYSDFYHINDTTWRHN